MSRTEIRRFDAWSSRLDEALLQLPEDPEWPHELYRALALNAAEHGRIRVYLYLDENGAPEFLIALALLRRGLWVPVTEWIVPGFVGIGSPRRLDAVLEKLPAKARVAWWRMPLPPPQAGNVRSAQLEPTFGMRLTERFHEHWRRGHLYQTLNKARVRCAPFAFVVNAPGAAEYTIRSSAQHLSATEPQPSHETDARLLFAAMMEPRQRYYTFSLMDGDKYVASFTACRHRRDLVALVTIRDRSYDSFDAGNHLMERMAHWALDAGYEMLDIGGSFDYKKRWGPIVGSKGKLHVYPPVTYAAHLAAQPLLKAYRAGCCFVSFVHSFF
jgi:hypothetical protein